MIIMSTGLCNQLLANNPFKTIFNLCFITIYGGTPPTHADQDVTVNGGGSLLCKISNNSTATGLTWGTATGGVLSKTGAEVWSGLNLLTGVATFFRVNIAGYTTTVSASEARAQGVPGTGGVVDMIMGNLTLTSGLTTTLPYGTISLPIA